MSARYYTMQTKDYKYEKNTTSYPQGAYSLNPQIIKQNKVSISLDIIQRKGHCMHKVYIKHFL